MTFQSNQVEFRVTQTQKLIAAKALEAATQQEVHPEHPMVEIVARSIVILQRGRMATYFDHGLRSSHFSRAHREPEQVAQEILDVESKVHAFNTSIDDAKGEAARRIRANQTRLERDRMRELEQQDYEAVDLEILAQLYDQGLLG